jgi:hypothetical protein
MLRRSLKQTEKTVKGSPVFSMQLHHRWPLPSTPISAYPLIARRQFQWIVKTPSRATDSLALTVRIRCQHHMISRMLKKSASGVFPSLRNSTYRSVRLRLFARCGLTWTRRVSSRRGWAGEKPGLLGHPARCSLVVPDERTIECTPCNNNFSAAC